MRYLFLLLLVSPLITFSQSDSVMTNKSGNSIVLKEHKFYEYQKQKNIATKHLERSGNLQIASYSTLIVALALAGVGISLDNPAFVVTSTAIGGISIPLGIASGVKKKKAAKDLWKASFYELAD